MNLSFLHRYKQYDFIVFALLTLFAVLSGQTTVFYLIYFFWWAELITIIVDLVMQDKNPHAAPRLQEGQNPLAGFVLMGIYLIFIVVLFGFFGFWADKHSLRINIQILLFQNWFFNLNLLFLIFERIYLHKKQTPLTLHIGAFTPNMIILHIAIVLGGMVIFFVTKPRPEVFSPDNPWGAVLIALPFILLRMVGVGVFRGKVEDKKASS